MNEHVQSTTSVRQTDTTPAEIVLSEELQAELKRGINYCLTRHGMVTDPANAFFHQGNYFALDGQVEQAIESYRESIAVDDDNWEARYALAVVLCVKWKATKDQAAIKESVRLYHQIINARPRFAPAYFQLGTLLEQSPCGEAALYFSECLRLDPANADAELKLAKYKMWMHGDVSEGLRHFERALTLRPDWLEAYDEASFYQQYLTGEDGTWLREHLTLERKRKTESARVHQVANLPIRFLRGILPAIGHYAYLDDLVKQQQLNLLPSYRLMLLGKDGGVCNPALAEYWSKYVDVITDPLAVESFKPLEKMLEFDQADCVEFNEQFEGCSFKLANAVQERWEREGRAPLLTLSDEHYERGWKTLERLGIPRSGWFVGLHVRDDGFKGPDVQDSLRNADIKTFIPALRRIAEHGGWVIRMGDPKMAPLPKLPNVIDYARSEIKSDWMDVFLWGACRFYFGGNSGPSWIPHTFGVPTLRVNWAPLTRIPWCSRDLVIPKMFTRVSDGSLLTFREMVDPTGLVSWVHSGETIARRGLRPIDNTPEELVEAVEEMLSRIAGNFSTTAEDEELQRCILRTITTVTAGHQMGNHTSRVCRAFLKRYKNLLGDEI